MRACVVVLVVACAGCGFRRGTAQQFDGGLGSDASTARQQAGVFAGGGRAKTGTITIDVQVGTPVQVVKSQSNTITISGSPVVKP